MSDSVVVTTLVEVDAATAFAVFTSEIDLWWRREARFRAGGAMRFDDQRLVEIVGERVIELGRVTAWEPPRRLVVAWLGTSKVAGAETEVEVRFDPEGAATRVTIEHRGWDRVPALHPGRHGLGTGIAFDSLIGGWWADLLTALLSYKERRSASQAR
ncbi:MAG TPA: SRPBCC domain-containing protein [Kofleriaceae bacterium]|nr:SRPBCC domain-containing protein [Kofleriaceae bacterium]